MRREWRSGQPIATQHDDAAVPLGARDGIVEKPAQVFRAARDGVRPEDDDVRELPILSTLNRHGQMATVLSDSQTTLIASGFTDEL